MAIVDNAAGKAGPPKTALEVKEKLRGRHPATQMNGPLLVPGGWTTIEEYAGLDLLAFSAHATPAQGAQRPPKGARYPRVGYEVKVSRADYRAELLKPSKRLRARLICHELYLAVPKGLLTAAELAFVEPPHFKDAKSFVRERCPNRCEQMYKNRRRTGPYLVDRADFDWGRDPYESRSEVCPVCSGKGYLKKSTAEEEAPQLWVPADVGLIEVDGRGCSVKKPSPVNHEARLELDDPALADLIRWVSARPDPRHSGVVERARERRRGLTSTLKRTVKTSPATRARRRPKTS